MAVFVPIWWQNFSPSEHLIIWVYSKPCFRVLFTEDLIDQVTLSQYSVTHKSDIHSPSLANIIIILPARKLPFAWQNVHNIEIFWFQDKPYDVFLSYSHEDEAWVEQVYCALMSVRYLWSLEMSIPPSSPIIVHVWCFKRHNEVHRTQVLAAGLENPSEGGEGMQYRCCIHTRDWKVGVI